MKKYIITSACTLVLSLIGALGSNQNGLNLDKVLNQNTNTTQVVENVTDTDADLNQSIPSDEQITDAANADSNTNKDAEELTPQAKESTDKKNIKVVDTKDKKEVNKAEAKKETVNKAANKKSSSNNSSAVKANANTVKKETMTNDANTNSSSKNKGQTYVYKNVDLSNCSNIDEIVSRLQNNGFGGINKSNIKNIDSLNEIIAAIQNKQSSDNQTASTPTKAPVAQKPAATATPAPTKAPTSTTKPSTDTNTGISNYANEVLRLVNIERAKAGLSALTTNQTLTAAANKRAQETVQSFSHTRPNGTSFSTVLQEYGVSYRTAGENIAYGQKTPQEVVTGWMNSPGHRANILNANFNKIGIGVYQSNGRIYWSQLFTN